MQVYIFVNLFECILTAIFTVVSKIASCYTSNLQTCRLCKILMAAEHTGKVRNRLTMWLKKPSGK